MQVSNLRTFKSIGDFAEFYPLFNGYLKNELIWEKRDSRKG